MPLEYIRLKNYKAFRDVTLDNLPSMCVIVGANGTGKSTLFGLFEFLKDALTENLNAAFAKAGGRRGFKDVRSRGAKGPIEIQLKFRFDDGEHSPRVTYSLCIGEQDESLIIEKETLSYRLGSTGKAWDILEFSHGVGEALVDNPEKAGEANEPKSERMVLKSPDTLALKAVMLQQKFPAAMALGDLITNWHISDFHIQRARSEQEMGLAEHLSREGENLALVAEYLYRHHKSVFDGILARLKMRVPGLDRVEPKITDEGRVLLRFQDGAFADPFLAQNVSDGTIKMLAYLILLHDPRPHPLLCVEEPENQLYPGLLFELAEEFREYARRGGQVFVSTHSPDFLNACRLDEVFWLVKKNGETKTFRAADDKQVAAYMAEDDEKLGYLWKQGFFGEADPA